MRSRLIVVAVMVATFAGIGLAEAGETRRMGLSPVNRYATDLIEAARARSATVRDLERAIESSNIVVYLNSDWRPAGEPSAHMRWLTEAAGVRYVLVFVDIQVPPHRRIELLGHELRHVLELADATWVHNESDIRRLFEGIGHPTSPGRVDNKFETMAARVTEQQVRRDLWEVSTPPTEETMAVARK